MKKLKLGLLGRDVSGSESERMHRFILSAQGVACDYENVSAGAEEFVPAVKRLLRETDGFNVTIPYKREIFQYLKSIEGDAAEFGSVNTVISATRTGFNTDGAGFMMMLSGAGLAAEGRTALVLGAGGAGRSTAAVLKRAGAKVFLYRKRKELLEDVCRELGVEPATEVFPCELFINCTGVGMHESAGVSPLKREQIEQCAAAVDLIYRPAESEFLRLARSCGKKTLNGRAMLFYQAYLSDCLYLGRRPDAGEAEKMYRAYADEK